MIECSYCHRQNPTAFCECPLSPGKSRAKHFFPQWALDHIVGLPDFPLATDFTYLTQNTKYSVIWRCGRCSKQFRKVSGQGDRLKTAIDQQILCLACWREANPRKHASLQVSRFELEMAGYLKLMFGKRLRFQHSYPLLDVARNKHRIDFYCEELDLGVEVDPFYFHVGKDDKDAHMYELLVASKLFTHVYRLRDHRLQETERSGAYIQVGPSGGRKEASSMDYALALASLAADLGGPAADAVPPEKAQEVRVAAKAEWLTLRDTYSNRKPLMDRRGYKRPERKRPCEHCGNLFSTGNKRTRYCSGTCAAEVREQAKRSALSFEESMAVLFPEVAALFISNLTRPGMGPEGISKGSRDYCEFRCYCGFHSPCVQAGTYIFNWYNQHRYTRRHKEHQRG